MGLEGLGGKDGSEQKLKVGLEGIKVMEKSRILPQHGFLHFLGQYYCPSLKLLVWGCG